MCAFFKVILMSSANLALLMLFLTPQLFAENRLPGAFARQPSTGADGGGFSTAWTTLTVNRDQLNDASSAAGFPGISDSVMNLYSAGAVFNKGAARVSVMGMTGSLASEKNGANSNWGLDMVGIFAEQRYPGSSWEVTAGFFTGYGLFGVEYRDAVGYSRFESRFIGTGGTAGARWPTHTRLSFFLRSGYFWLPAAGAWHGTLAGKMAKTYYDLSAPFAQVGMDLLF